ncbi:MAG: response regulator [Candidatus Competibacteraceae bacterium]|nr:response regulator [Candidatus Competibacteraceae bacterium]
MPNQILVVDDSQTVRSVITKTLVLTGLDPGDIHQAANGQDALVFMRANPVNLVFTDINMPVMSGIAMVEIMRSTPELAGIPVVVVSTEGSRKRIDELLATGIQAYIRKPFSPEMLGQVIEQLLGARNE